jgi:hypothetical protein
VDVALCERFGWTWDELDAQDESRVLPAVSAANIAAAAGRISTWLAAAGQGSKVAQPPAADWKAWKLVQDAKKANPL